MTLEFVCCLPEMQHKKTPVFCILSLPFRNLTVDNSFQDLEHVEFPVYNPPKANIVNTEKLRLEVLENMEDVSEEASKDDTKIDEDIQDVEMKIDQVKIGKKKRLLKVSLLFCVKH